MVPVEELGLVWRGFDINPRSKETSAWDINTPIFIDVDSPNVVLMLDVLEHCGNPELVLSNIARLLNDGGVRIYQNQILVGARVD